MGFDVMPWHSVAIWMLTQMKRWGYLKENINYQNIAEQVFLLTDAKRQMTAMGYALRDEPEIKVMGKPFDATRPDEYLKSFAIGAKG